MSDDILAIRRTQTLYGVSTAPQSSQAYPVSLASFRVSRVWPRVVHQVGYVPRLRLFLSTQGACFGPATTARCWQS